MTTDAVATLPLSPKQIRSIVESESARISIWEGAVRSGKTVSSLIGFLAAVATAPPTGLIVITGRTLQTIERNIIEPLQDPGVMGPLADSVQHTRGSSIAQIFGRDVHLIGAADVRAEGKLRGMTACLAMVDEATLLPEPFFTQLLARLSVPGARLLVTTNPGSPSHWLKKKFIDRKDEPGMSVATWHFLLDDNPSLDEHFLAAIKAENTGLFYRRNILGEWVQAEGAVYSMWDDTRHVIPAASLPPMERVLALGCDYGSRDNTIGLLLGVADGTLYFLDEWAPVSATDAEYSASLIRWLHTRPEPMWRSPEWLFVDPAGASFKMQLRRDGLANTRNAANEVLDGIRTVASLLATDRLKVSSSCKTLIREIPGYVWDDKAAEKGIDAVRKENDHASDAARYALMSSMLLWRNHVPLTALSVPDLDEPLEEAS